MICKNCGTWNMDDQLLCEKCSNVLDPSLLAGEVVDVMEQVTGEKFYGDSVEMMGKDVPVLRRNKNKKPTSAVGILGGDR